MREMKDSGVSWIGNIPANWITLPAKHCVSISHGSDPKTTGDIPVYGSGNDIVKTCGEFKEGPCVLIGRKGSIDSPKYIEGRYWNVDTAFDVKPKGSFNLRYYYYQSICFDYKVLIKQTTLPSMTSSQYNNMFIAKPPIDEQQKIASYLDSKCSQVDEAIRRQESIIGKLKEYRQSVITEAVTKGLDPNAEMNDSGIEYIGNIPSCWPLFRIKYIAENYTEKASHHFLYIGMENIESWTGAFVKTAEYSPSGDSLMARRGQVIFGKLRPYLAKVSIVSENVRCSTEFIVISTKPSIMASFLRYYLVNKMFIDHVDQSTWGTKMPRTDWNYIGNCLCPVPSVEEQQSIVSYLDSKCSQIDEAIRRQESIINKLKAYRQSLIYEVVTGKKEVV